MKNIIEIKNMSISYKEKQILDHISLDIRNGSYVTICGKNGVGKSTFIKSLLGLIAIEGEIKIDGILLEDGNLKKIRSIMSVVFENPNTNLICETVEDELRFTLKNLGYKKIECDAKVRELADKLKMEHLLPKLTTHLSGGEKQFVAFASAIITEPKILILDEAFTMLDGVSKEKIMKYIKKYYKETKCTILHVTNDMEDILYGTDIMLLKEGFLLAFDKKEVLLKDEKKFKEAGLNLPFMADLSLKLKYYGLVDEPILEVDKMVNHLWKSK